MAVLLLNLFLSFLLTRLRQMEYSFVSVIYFFLDIGLHTILKIYRVKYVKNKGIQKDILDSIHYSDECFTQIGVELPPKKKLFLFSLYVTVIIVVNGINCAIIVKELYSVQWMERVNDNRSLWIMLLKFIVLFSGMFLLSKVTILLYTVKPVSYTHLDVYKRQA